jgi:hypothetical protein
MGSFLGANNHSYLSRGNGLAPFHRGIVLRSPGQVSPGWASRAFKVGLGQDPSTYQSGAGPGVFPGTVSAFLGTAKMLPGTLLVFLGASDKRVSHGRSSLAGMHLRDRYIRHTTLR